MKNYGREIAFGIGLLLVFAIFLFWIVIIAPQNYLIVGIAFGIVLLGLATFLRQTIKKKQAAETGEPIDDEFTNLAKIYAGNQAFLYSMYLWLLIFIFNSSFTKHETMLGIGILGSALIYGISLWYFRTTGAFNAQ
jgi:ABC-type uncharacterized transport system permease subunit